MAHSDRIPPTTDICNRYHFLGEKEFPWGFPFSMAKFFGMQEKLEHVLKSAKGSPVGRSTCLSGKQLAPRVGGAPDGNFLMELLPKLMPLVQWLFGDELPLRAELSRELDLWISEFKPQVIYTILGNLSYIRLVRKVAQKYNLPVVVHMMDDWPAVMYRRGLLGPWRRWRLQIELQQIMNDAAACLAICPQMAEAYEKRYGRKFTAFHNALDPNEWIQKARKEWSRTSEGEAKLLYAGALIAHSQVESVRDVCDAVAALHAEGLDIEFHIYAPYYAATRYRAELERPECVKIFDAPDTMDIEALFAEADILLLPVNFDEESVKYIRYSMPTKVPAYMFSGTPTLAYGPLDVASIGYAQKEQWAYCVTEKNPELLKTAIKTLFADENLRKNLALRAQELARERHDRNKIAAEFQEILIHASHPE